MTDTVERRSWYVENDELFVSDDGWLRFARPRPQAAVRLVCFPPAGVEAFMYDAWGELLPETVELCAIQLPEGEEFQDVNHLIATLADSLVEYSYPSQKLSFFGACLGSLWAYEVARYLRTNYNIEVAHLIVSTYPAPDQQAPSIAFMRTPKFTEILTSYFPPESPEYDYILSRMPASLQAADLAEQPLPAFDRPLDCPITAFASAYDQIVDPNVLPTWRPYTSASFHIHTFDGDHFYGDHHMEEFVQAIISYVEANVLQRV